MSWTVYRPYVRNGKRRLREIDVVWYIKNCDAEYVRTSLINHDGYPYDIVVRSN